MQCILFIITVCTLQYVTLLYHLFLFLPRLHPYLLRHLSYPFVLHHLRLHQTRAISSMHPLLRQISAGLPIQNQKNRKYNHILFPLHRHRRFPRKLHHPRHFSFFFSFAVELRHLNCILYLSI